MNLFELFVKIGVDDQASSKIVNITKKLGGGLKTAAKIGTAAVSVASGAIVALTKQAVDSYAEYEQLVGGAQKIFDQMDYSKIAKDANNAYKELGLSANQYLAVINDVGATFAATMGDEAGYEAAKIGLKAISDYASGTGKNVDELSQKFTLITRSTSSYQSIADQFSGILPATSAGFLEQAQAAGILSDSYTQLTEVPIDEYQAAVSQMLQQGVKDLGLANNTVNEAFSTLSGSLSMAKGAWSNLVTGLANDSADLDMLIGNFVESVGAVATQILPKVQTALEGAGKLVETLVPIIIEQIPSIVEDTLPKMLESGVKIIQKILEGISKDPDRIVDTVFEVIDILIDAIVDNLPQILSTGALLLGKFAIGIINAIPDLVRRIPEIIRAIKDEFSSHSGEFSNIGDEIINGVWAGIQNAIGWFTDKVSSFFSGIVDSVKATLGIASPSKVFRAIGGFMAQGLGVGWDDEIGDIQDEINGSLDFGGGSVSLSSVNGGVGGRPINITQNIYAQKKSAAQLMQEARWQAQMGVLAVV